MYLCVSLLKSDHWKYLGVNFFFQIDELLKNVLKNFHSLEHVLYNIRNNM